MRAAVYARLSRKKPKEELGINIKDQEKIGEELANRRGWTLIETPFTDDDRGAYKDDARRPRWDAMLKAAPDVIIVREAERLGRNIPDYAKLLATKAKVVEWLDEENPGEVDWDARPQNTDTDQFAYKMVGARGFSRRMGAKIARKAMLKAQAGGWPHGGTRPFGYHHACCRGEKNAVTCTYGEIIPAEAKIIHEIAERWLAGESLSALCRDLTERGVVTPTGKPWQYARLRQMLAGPRIAGIRTYKGTETKGTWESIVSDDLHRRLVTAASESLKKRAAQNGTYTLGPGLLTCGRCGRNMYGVKRKDKGVVTRVTYVCTEGCGQGIAARQAEEVVVGRSLLSILAPELRDRAQAKAEVADLRAQVDDLEARIAALDAAYWEERLITKDRWMVVSRSLSGSLDETRRHLTDVRQSLTRERDLPDTAEDLAKRWGNADEAERCRLLRVGVESVVIHPHTSPRSAFDPTRIEIRFRDGRVQRITADDVITGKPF